MSKDNLNEEKEIKVKRRRIGEEQAHAAEEPAKKKMSKPVKVLIIVLSVILAIIIAAGAILVPKYLAAKNNPEQAFDIKPEESKQVVVNNKEDQTYTKQSGIYNILLLGIDSNKEREAKHYGWRSDVMMLCSINFDDNTMHLTSVPRDMWVTVPKAMDDDGNVTSSVSQRINTAYSFGGGPDKDGAKFAMKCMEDFLSVDGQFDIDIDYFVSIDIDGLYQLADDIGGVEVVMDRDVKGVGSKGQTVTINRNNIDAYIRTRKGAGDDPGRVSRQQDYIMAVAKKVKEMGTTEAITSMYGTITKYAKTNLTLDQCLSLASFVKGFDLDNLTKYTVTGHGYRTAGGASVLGVNEDELKDYLLEYFYEEQAKE